MMDKARRVFIDGDINDEIVGHVANLLREHQINADLEPDFPVIWACAGQEPEPLNGELFGDVVEVIF